MNKKKSIPHELLVVDVMRTAEILMSRLSKILKKHAITGVQYNILRILRGARPEMLGVGEVKQRVLFSKSDISRLIDRLVIKGLVERTICPENRRKMNVCISESGIELLALLDIEIPNELNGFYKDKISIGEVESTRAILKKISDGE